MASSGADGVNLDQLEKVVQRDYVTLRQVAHLLGVSYQTVLRYKKDGKLHAFQVGGRWRVKVTELKRFAQEGNAPNGSDGANGNPDTDLE